jgi:UDP-arabinose 4-epimerase
VTNILVTGGAGYIGSHTCKALAHAGYTPIAYDNLSTGHAWFVKWGPFERGDILDYPRLSGVIAAYKPEAVIHFAACASVGESVRNPAKYYRNNVLGTFNVLEAMRENGLTKLVCSSTCAVYGIPDRVPIPEYAPLRPVNPYGRSKLIVERILGDYKVAYNLNSVSLRYFNAAGADPDGELGEDHDPETHLIPLILAAAAGDRPDATIFGDDYDTPDGTCIRDYVHVSDIASAHVLALSRLDQGSSGFTYNLGTGRGHSVAQIIDTAREVTGRPIRVICGARRAGDPPHLIANSALAFKELGWTHRHSTLEEIVETAWRWRIRPA